MSVILTESMIRDQRSGRGGWTMGQFMAIGIDWPPQKGWMNEVVGKTISEEQWKDFCDARRAY